jgi:hypothetical protein
MTSGPHAPAPAHTETVNGVLDALRVAIDAERLEKEIAGRFASGGAVQKKVLLEDILDDSILAAKATDKSFPLRIFFSTLGEALDDDVAFAVTSGLNFFFRWSMDEEVKMRVGLEISRGYYELVLAGKVDRPTAQKLSPLFAALLSTELSRVRFEAVDHLTTFDSAQHERDEASNKENAAVRQPMTFLARVTGNNAVRVKALVRT